MRPSFFLTVAAFVVGCAGGVPPDDRRGGSFCEQVGSYASPCPDVVGCDGALARDCAGLSGVIAESLELAAGECMSNLGAPMECLAGAVDQTTSSTALESFAQTFCLACGDGSDTCWQDALAGDGDEPAGRAGRIARALAPSGLDELGDRCASEDGCGEGFEDCAREFLARIVPSETASCLLDAVAERGLAPDCGGAEGTTDGGADGSASSSASSDGAHDDASTDEGSTEDGEVPCDGELGCACGVDAPCADLLVCEAGVCIETAACDPDEFEGNGTEDTAYLLGLIGDLDSYGGTVNASLDGDGDVDWFQYQGIDEFGAFVNPYAAVSVLSLRVCIYAECLEEGLAATAVTCPEGTMQSPSPGGRPGCCAEGNPGFELDLECGGFNPIGNEDAIISMRVEGGELGVCQDYSLSFHF